MQIVFVWDDAQETDHCFNLYACDACGLMCKHDLWEHAGKLWIHLDGMIEKG